MLFDFDPDKDLINQATHGIAFADFCGFDANPEPLVVVDDRQAYGETRFQTFGRIGGKGYMIVTTQREGRTRLISFRRAHEKEMKRYGFW